MIDTHTTFKLYSWLRRVFWITTGSAILGQLFFIPFYKAWPVVAGFFVYTALLLVLNARLKSVGIAWPWLAFLLLIPAIGYLMSFAAIERSMIAFRRSQIDGGALAIDGSTRFSTTKRFLGVGATCCILAMGAVAYAKGGIRSNATDCFVATVKQQAASNTAAKGNDLRDVPLEAVASCTAQRNSVFENMLFDRADIGRYVRVRSPAP